MACHEYAQSFLTFIYLVCLHNHHRFGTSSPGSCSCGVYSSPRLSRIKGHWWVVVVALPVLWCYFRCIIFSYLTAEEVTALFAVLIMPHILTPW